MLPTLLFAGFGKLSNLILLRCAGAAKTSALPTSFRWRAISLPQASSMRSARTPGSRTGQTRAIF